MPFFDLKKPDKFIAIFNEDSSLADLEKAKRTLLSKNKRTRKAIHEKTSQLRTLTITLQEERSALLTLRDKAQIEEDHRQSTLADILDNYSADDFIIKNQLLNYSPYAICKTQCKPIEDHIQTLLKEKEALQRMILVLKQSKRDYKAQIKIVNDYIDTLTTTAGTERSIYP